MYYGQNKEAELARIAAQLKEIADQLLECAKGDSKEDDEEDDKEDTSSSMRLKAVKLSKMMK